MVTQCSKVRTHIIPVILVLLVLPVACGKTAEDPVNFAQEPLTPEAEEAQSVARIVFDNTVVGVAVVEKSLGCVKSTATKFNQAEDSYRAQTSGAIVPLENAAPSAEVWVCDFSGKFGSAAKPTSYARVVIKTFDPSAVQNPPLNRGLGIWFYKERPPAVAAT